MKRFIYFTGVSLLSLFFLAGCAKDMSTTEVSTIDSDASVTTDETSAISESGDAVQFDIGEEPGEETQSESDSPDVFDPLSVRTVYFDYDESKVNDEGQQVIRAHAEVLLNNPDASLHIAGHADERGTREYNLALGDQRAQAVSSYFQEFGVDGSRITVVSYGEEQPAAIGSDEAAWTLNRRAEFDY